MNQKNLEYLKDGLKYMGFGEGLNNRLTEEISSGKKEFQLNTMNEYGRDKISYALNFKKSDQSDMYFFNKYKATFKADDNSFERTQDFYIKKNAGVTAKEAYNLLNGRAVYKDLTNQEGEKYNAWLQLDFNQKDDNGNQKFKVVHQAYGYDLEKTLSRFPIKDLDRAEFKDRLIKSLERGNLHEVIFQNGDSTEKRFIEANPQFKTLNVYDASLKKLFIENEKKQVKDVKAQQSEKKGLPSKDDDRKEEKKKDDQKKEVKQSLDEESSTKEKKTIKRPKLSMN